jgi:polysaccharide chain length determinant protein (PEP-CTERM system associated)
MRIGLSGPQDFLALLVRRKWWIIVPFVALSGAMAILTYSLPKTYVSETLILVRQRDVPEEFVKDLIGGTPEERLKSIEQTILSRTNLIQILREFGDRLPEFQRLNMDARVVKLRDQIRITFQLERSNRRQDVPLTYFRISYQNQNPDLAQKIATKLTALFIEQDSKIRESQVFGTTEFLSAELEKVSQQLAESEARLKDVKSSRQFELPEYLDTNLKTLDRLANDKKANSEALDRYATIRLNLETQLSQIPQMIQKSVPPSPPVPRNPLETQIAEYRKAQSEYDEVASRYTEKHPEVQAAKARADRLKERIPTEILAAALASPATDGTETSSTSLKEPNPVYQKLAAQLQEAKTEFEIREREKDWIQGEIAKYNSRVENTPLAEQDIGDVVRQNEDLKKQYEDLKGKLSDARLSESLESQQRGSQFVIVDPANYPLVPAKPNQLAVLLGVALISLAISLAVATALDVARQKVWTQSQIEAFWGVPVLVEIPEIVSQEDSTLVRKKRLWLAVSSVAGLAAYSVCLYGVYLKHGFILQQIDPIIQRLVYR